MRSPPSGLADKFAHITIDAYNPVPQRASADQEARASLARIRNDKKVLEENRILPAHTGMEDR